MLRGGGFVPLTRSQGRHLPAVLTVQVPLYPLSGEGYVFRISCSVCRDIVPVPEAGLGSIALFLEDDPDPVPHTYRLQDTAEPREGDLHEGLVCLRVMSLHSTLVSHIYVSW